MKAVVIGAGPAGLAVAASLQDRGAEVAIYERAADVGSAWREHYDCLTLHTAKGRSTLPGLDYPPSVPRYPSRLDVIQYLEDYTTHHGLSPVFGTNVTGIARAGGTWRVTYADGHVDSDVVVVATGMNARAVLPDWAGQTNFKGGIIHAADYKNPSAYAGKRVLVAGFGNSGGDIALDLARAGVAVTLSVRGPVNILPKQLFGIPITSFGLLSKILGYKTADALTAPILRMVVGRPEDYGLRSSGKGPGARVIEDGRIPLIDTGTLAAIRAGKIAVKPGIDALTAVGATFADGTTGEYDQIIAATGYAPNVAPLLAGNGAVLNADGQPRVSGGDTGEPGLYFCGFRVSPDGQLFATSREARAIADHAAAQFSLATSV